MKAFKLWLYRMFTWWLPESRGFAFKVMLLRWAGAKIGSNVRIYTSAKFLGVGALEIGDDVHIGPDVFVALTADAVVKIGSRVDIAPGVMILTGSHEINREPGGHAAGMGTSKSVVIEDGCWIGARAIILPGKTIGEGAVVGAGSVATKDVKSGDVVVGVPARAMINKS